MAKKEIKTAIHISASPERVWEVFTDFENYPNWNPFITSIEGEVKIGNNIKINAGGMKFKPVVLNFTLMKEFRWKGKFIMKGLFDGEHIFQIVDNKDGSVTFKQEEIFSGFLVPFFNKKLDTDTKSGFEQMNQKLKELAEK